jgi:hypothetical protein
MMSPLLPLSLALGAVGADAVGLHRLAFYLVLVAIVPAAASALFQAGELVEGKQVLFRVSCSGGGLVLLVLSSAVRANAVHVPPIAVSALIGAVAAYAAVALASLISATQPRPLPELER